VLDGDSVPFSQKGRSPLPKFSAHLYCGEMAACIKMPLDMKLGLGPGDFVLDPYLTQSRLGRGLASYPLPPSPKGAQPTIFGPYLLRPNG